jgi:glycosyltransferase involved in cell wall biosynthesis
VSANMRIVQLVPAGVHPYSGLLTSVCGLAAALVDHVHQSEVWFTGEWPQGAGELAEELDEAGVIRRDASSIGMLSSAQSAERPDLIHLHGVFNLPNIRTARHLTVPYFVSPHGGYASGSLSYHRFRKQVFAYLFELPMLRRARAVCALTQAEALEIRRFGYRGPVCMVHNGVSQAPVEVDGLAFRQKLGLSPSDKLAVYVGRVDVRGKRLQEVIAGIADAEQWHLAIVGGDFRDGVAELGRTIESGTARGRVHLIGPRRGPAIHEVYAAADVFVLLSRSEGMPMALLEAASHGVPAIISSEVAPCLPVIEENAGWMVQPENLSDLLSRLAGPSQSEILVKSRSARLLAERFSWRSVAGRYSQYAFKAIHDESAFLDIAHQVA